MTNFISSFWEDSARQIVLQILVWVRYTNFEILFQNFCSECRIFPTVIYKFAKNLIAWLSTWATPELFDVLQIVKLIYMVYYYNSLITCKCGILFYFPIITKRVEMFFLRLYFISFTFQNDIFVKLDSCKTQINLLGFLCQPELFAVRIQEVTWSPILFMISNISDSKLYSIILYIVMSHTLTSINVILQ